jgi:hypothetical protein
MLVCSLLLWLLPLFVACECVAAGVGGGLNNRKVAMFVTAGSLMIAGQCLPDEHHCTANMYSGTLA